MTFRLARKETKDKYRHLIALLRNTRGGGLQSDRQHTCNLSQPLDGATDRTRRMRSILMMNVHFTSLMMSVFPALLVVTGLSTVREDA